ncbi:ribosome silencing factor [Meridianimarinicoccus roseus]|uniref:Ribosomal silencing factor RsfS n=1 Tax=Meridianimarinicoccus roseus TaxID=2072018 RepID=A0A2V2LEG8_9RHOB|nr:ribosome silencing factor [Meridianimarinicoccus roseus]PWR01894.1 ribosome silencing factor [Meridianimarinicoccus roseus]
MRQALRIARPGAIFTASCPRCGHPTTEDIVLSHSAQAVSVGAAPTAAGHGLPDQAQSDDTLARILSSLSDNKAEDVVSIDLRGRTEMADFMVIATGRSSRQVGAMAEKLLERLKQDFGITCKVEGKEQGDWVLIDAGDAVVHLFRPEVRDFYQLEKMWQQPDAVRR